MSLQRILTAGPGFTDCTALGEGRTYYIAGADPGTGVTIEAGTSVAAGPGAPVGYLPSGNGSASIRLADDNSTFLRFSVTSGNLGSGQVWVTGPNDPAAPYIAAVNFNVTAHDPGGAVTFTEHVESIYGMTFTGVTVFPGSVIEVDFALQSPLAHTDRDQLISIYLEAAMPVNPFQPIAVIISPGIPATVQIAIPIDNTPPPPGSPDVTLGITYQLNKIPP